MKRILVCLSVFVMGLTASADVVLPAVMNSKMVLQRGVEVPIWGWADQGEEVTVAFAGQSKKATPDKNGKWLLRLDPMPASTENRSLTIAGKNTITLKDVLVGEVWLASGQSNMEWSFARIHGSEQKLAVTEKDNKLIRVFHVSQHLVAGVPLDDTVGAWKDCSEILKDSGKAWTTSAVGFFFALKLQQELKVPVALLDANWGGQRIEPFIPHEGYEAMGMKYKKSAKIDPKAHAANLRRAAAEINNAAAMAEKGLLVPLQQNLSLGRADNGIYNAMVAPLTPYAIKGAIWYQGESNRGSNDYFKKLQALSAGWSQVFGVKDIPFYQVQIAPYDYGRGKKNTDSTLCNNIWRAQYKGAAEIAGMGVVAIHDTNINIKDIHPSFKKPVGERLAAQALKKQYGKDVVTTGPAFASAKASGAVVTVGFKDVDQGLSTSDGKAPTWFELSADGKTFVGAEAVIKGNTVELTAAAVKAPKFVRMGWYDIAIPTLKDKNGWPVFAFPAQAVK